MEELARPLAVNVSKGSQVHSAKTILMSVTRITISAVTVGHASIVLGAFTASVRRAGQGKNAKTILMNVLNRHHVDKIAFVSTKFEENVTPAQGLMVSLGNTVIHRQYMLAIL